MIIVSVLYSFTENGGVENIHSVGVHGLASVELKVLELGQEVLLDVGLSTLLEGSDVLGVSVLLHKSSLDSLHVA